VGANLTDHLMLRPVYKIKNKLVDTKIYFLILIIFDYSFHFKKLKKLIKKIIRY